MKTLKDLFLNELMDIYDAERRILKALPKMAAAATCADLKKAMEAHRTETEGHVTKLEQVFQTCDEKAKAHTCEATVGLLEEGEAMAAEFKGSPAINAALIASAQKVEHYEIASYGCLHEWAELLGNKKGAALLMSILEQEKCANETLNALAHGSINQEALKGLEPGETQNGLPGNKQAKTSAGNRPLGSGAPSDPVSKGAMPRRSPTSAKRAHTAKV